MKKKEKKEKLVKYDIHIKTSKKQWLYVGLEFVDLMVLPIIAIQFFKDSDIMMIITLALVFIIAIILCVLCVKDGKDNYDIANRRLNHLFAFQARMATFKYEKADEKIKKEYLMFKFYIAASISSCQKFYEEVYDFSLEEIKNMLFFDDNEELNIFIRDVICQLKESMSIKKFRSYILSKLEDFSDIDKFDPLLIDKNVLYDETRHHRCYVKTNKNNTYTVKEENFIETEKEISWTPVPHKTKYKSFDEAMNECVRINNEYNVSHSTLDFYTIKDINKENIRYNAMWSMFERNLLPLEMQVLCGYYMSVERLGHFGFLSMNEEDNEGSIDVLYRILPNNLYSNLSEANQSFKSRYSKEELKKYDTYFYQHEDQIITQLKQNSKELTFKIL